MSGVLVVIPARYGATRLPGKPLLAATGRPLVVHTLERVRAARCADRVVVATDNERVVAAVRAHGGEAVLTAPDHPTGSDRVAEVARQHPSPVVLNVQGDEPEVDPALLDALVAALSTEARAAWATASAPLPPHLDPRDPARVKVVADPGGRALYFSRAPIPFVRREGRAAPRLHIGVYAYRREALLRWAELPRTPLEETEELEQLRALEHGFWIQVVPWPRAHAGVDTPEDYRRFVERHREGV